MPVQLSTDIRRHAFMQEMPTDTMLAVLCLAYVGFVRWKLRLKDS